MGSGQAASPVQVLIIGFDGQAIPDEIQSAIGELRDHEDVRLVDALRLSREPDGTVQRHDLPDLRPGEPFAPDALRDLLDAASSRPVLSKPTLSGAPIQDRGVLFKADAIPDPQDAMPQNSNAVVLLLEHRWGARLRGAVADVGAYPVSGTWLTAEAVGRLGLPTPA